MAIDAENSIDEENDPRIDCGLSHSKFIRLWIAMEKFLNCSLVAKINDQQIEQIRLGIANYVSSLVYAKPEFSWEQMEQIRLGLQENLDVSQYANPDISYEKMSMIRNRLKEEKSEI